VRISPRPAVPCAVAAVAAALVAGGVSAPAAAVAASAEPAFSPGHSISTTPAAPAFATSAPAAVAGPAAGAYKYQDHAFILRLRGSAIQPWAAVPKELVTGIGYSAVNLEKEIGGTYSKCEIFGAGYWLTDPVEEGVLGSSGPPDAGNVAGGYRNPTVSKDSAPNLSPGENLNARKPQLRSYADGSVLYTLPHEGNGVRWQAKCDDDASGRAVGNNVDVPGAYGAGSTTVAKLDKKTGAYTGTTRSYVAGLDTGAGVVDLVTSTIQVKHALGKAPTLTYRIGVAGTTVASGTDVAVADLAKQFNQQVETNAVALKALGKMGLRLIGPEVGLSENGGRPVLYAPFLSAHYAPAGAYGGVGTNQGIRIGVTDYEGVNADGAIPVPKDGGTSVTG
jgi:hypothetical protein